MSAYSMLIPSREDRIKPAPLPWALVALSTDNLQMGRSDASRLVSVGSFEVNSMINVPKFSF